MPVSKQKETDSDNIQTTALSKALESKILTEVTLKKELEALELENQASKAELSNTIDRVTEALAGDVLGDVLKEDLAATAGKDLDTEEKDHDQEHQDKWNDLSKNHLDELDEILQYQYKIVKQEYEEFNEQVAASVNPLDKKTTEIESKISALYKEARDDNDKTLEGFATYNS